MLPIDKVKKIKKRTIAEANAIDKLLSTNATTHGQYVKLDMARGKLIEGVNLLSELLGE